MTAVQWAAGFGVLSAGAGALVAAYERPPDGPPVISFDAGDAVLIVGYGREYRPAGIRVSLRPLWTFADAASRIRAVVRSGDAVVALATLRNWSSAVGAEGASVIVIDAVTGRRRFASAANSAGGFSTRPLAADGESIYVVRRLETGTDSVQAFDPTDGNAPLASRVRVAPVRAGCAGGGALFARAGDSIVALDLRGGRPLWTTDLTPEDRR